MAFIRANWNFFHFFILGKIGQENELHDMVEGKNAFFDYKKEKLKKSKNWDCFKGVSPWFCIGNHMRPSTIKD